jgi:hypothetical protein
MNPLKTGRASWAIQRPLSRRSLLRGAGVAMTLPWLSAMERAFASTPSGSPKRFVAITLGLGLHQSNWKPEQSGFDYEPSLYLRNLQDLRRDMTVISGSSHPGVGGGHRAEASILTASPQGSSGRSRNTISLDQLMAKHLGDSTRFASLVLSANGSDSPCYTENGAMIPAMNSPRAVFERLFIDDTPAARALQSKRLQQGVSIMDLVGEDAKDLKRKLGTGDQDRLDAFFTSVRDLEKRMQESEQWTKRPKPKVDAKPPVDVGSPNDVIAKQRTMCDVIKLALETDSSRFITFHVGGAGGVVPIPGVEEGYHNLSHHGMDETKIAQLALVEQAIVEEWGQFLRSLKETKDQSGRLLDNTSVLLTSNLGNASNHDNRNMPVLLAGGGFRHGQHLAFDQKKNYPLPNLFVSLLQNVGIETDQFATSTGTLSGLS